MPNNKHTTPTDPLVSSSSIEITHDILAKKIYARIDADEKMRLKITQMLRDRHTYYLETGELLSKRDLAYIDPYLGQVETSEVQEAFIQKSRKAVKASENRRRMIIAGIGAILIAAAAVSIWFGIDAGKQAEKAEKAKISADSSADIASQEKIKADSLAKEAITSAEEARKAQKSADSLADIAQQNLANFQKATESIVASVLEDAQKDIYKLRYSEALKKYRDAYKLEKLPNEVAKGMMELAFFYHETGQPQLASGLADTTALLLGKRSQMRGSSDLKARLEQMHPAWYEEIHNRYYPKMIKIKGGRFKMGSKYVVELTDYELATTETTIWQYNLYCKATGQDSISRVKSGVSWSVEGDNPVWSVSWNDAVRYANWVSTQHGLNSVYFFKGDSVQINYEVKAYRLPTEAQWEYAAAGGIYGYEKDSLIRKYVYAGTSNEDSLKYYAWYSENSGNRTQPVGEKKPNPLGLYDMSGNVYEWCQDLYGSYPDTTINNPTGPLNSSRRVIRGGRWSYGASDCQVDVRYYSAPNYRGSSFGFRLTRTR